MTLPQDSGHKAGIAPTFWERVGALLDDYLDGYELIGGDPEGYYTPNKLEKTLLEDFTNGFLSELDERIFKNRLYKTEHALDSGNPLNAAAPDLLRSAKEVESILKFAFEDGALDKNTIMGLCVDPYGALHDLRAAIAKSQLPPAQEGE